MKTRRHSVECIRPPRHTEIGTVSLLANNRCVRVSEVDPNFNIITLVQTHHFFGP